MTVVEALDRTTSLAGDPVSVRAARLFVGRCLEEAGLAHLREDAELAVTELAANAVVHARTAFAVRIRVMGSTARVCVLDGDVRMPAMPSDDPDRPSGRGLRLVAAVTSDWGVDLRPAGKAVWFRVGSPVGPVDARRVDDFVLALDAPGVPALAPAATPAPRLSA